MDPKANTLGIFTEKVLQIACPQCSAELDVSEFNVFEDIVCPACGDEIKIPGRLGNHILIEELGRGAMGCVYLAQDESLGRLVALKVMRREFGDDPKMLETLQKEAQAMATLNHRNVVQVYSFGREDGQPYFVMELLQGERLETMVADGGRVPEVRLLEIASDVALGLQAAHNAGLTHGDIKPANILMNEQGVAKVVDFGLARFMETGGEIEVWGTPYYIAPEKARKKGEDSRSDQYSLGATLFHALAGQPPFDGETPTKVVLASLKEETPDVREHRPDVTAKTASVIKRMMDKTPSRRYPTYASLMADLEAAMQAARAEEQRRLLAEQKQSQVQEKKKTNRLPLIMAGVVVLLLAMGLGVVFRDALFPPRPVDVAYSGPERSLHGPILENEQRLFLQAAQALAANRPDRVGPLWVNARRDIPEAHAAHAWSNFLLAGILMYAEDLEGARALLEEVANQDPILFDGGLVPPEDPRLLAQLALGTVNTRTLERSLREAQPYFRHLHELASGYERKLANRSSAAARHFRAYAEFSPYGGIRWPYVLHPIAPWMHLPRAPLHISLDGESDPEAEEPNPAPASGRQAPAEAPPVPPPSSSPNT